MGGWVGGWVGGLGDEKGFQMFLSGFARFPEVFLNTFQNAPARQTRQPDGGLDVEHFLKVVKVCCGFVRRFNIVLHACHKLTSSSIYSKSGLHRVAFVGFLLLIGISCTLVTSIGESILFSAS